MSKVTVGSARAFVDGAQIPKAMRTRDAGAAGAAALVFDAAKDQAALVGSDIVSFAQGVTPQRREAIVNSTLFAQLVANKKSVNATDMMGWYSAYFDALTNIGWIIQDKGFAEYHEKSQSFEAHKAILEVAATLLGAAPTALAVVKATLDSLQNMAADSPFLAIFDRESQHAKTARFQVSLVEQQPGGEFFVTLMAFALEAQATLTQVLFFKSKKSEASLRHASGKVSMNTPVLDAVSPTIKQKLVDHAAAFVKQFPDL
jgi:hypothetical protein